MPLVGVEPVNRFGSKKVAQIDYSPPPVAAMLPCAAQPLVLLRNRYALSDLMRLTKYRSQGRLVCVDFSSKSPPVATIRTRILVQLFKSAQRRSLVEVEPQPRL